MRRRELTLVLGVAMLAACSRQEAKTEAPADAATRAITDPAAVIRPLYDRYMTDPAAATFPALEDQAPWSAAMRQALVDMLARSETADAPILDFDPFVNAQDWQIANLNVTTDGVVENSHAVVRASFTNGGAPHEVSYDMVWENDSWRVDNMRSGGPPDGWDLRQIAAQASTP